MGNDPCERDGLVIAQGHVSSAHVVEAIDQFLSLRPVPAKEDVRVFERGSLERDVAPRSERSAKLCHDPLTARGGFWKVVVEPLQGSRLYPYFPVGLRAPCRFCRSLLEFRWGGFLADHGA